MTNEGPQMKAFKAMVDRVISPRDESKWDYTSDNANIYAGPFSENFIWQPYLFFKNFCELVLTLASMLYELVFVFGF